MGVNTSLPNKLVFTACEQNAIPGLEGYGALRREVKYGKNSRIDVLLEDHPDDPRPCYVEVKNVTLEDGGIARFPDAVTARGLKHLGELSQVVREGGRAIAFFLIQRQDCDAFGPAWEIDPAYAAGLVEASAAGVEVMAYTAVVEPGGVGLGSPLPVVLDPPEPQA